MARSISLSEQLEEYVRRMNRPEHPALARCRTETYASADLPTMQISPQQAAFMMMQARLISAQTYVEVGVFTGYSTLAMALALRETHGDNARIIACDISEKFVDQARGYWREAGVDDLIDAKIGPAAESLATLPDDFADIMFVDAEKSGYPAYYQAGARLLRRGGLMMLDNVIWSGAVADQSINDDDTRALRQIAKTARDDERFDIAFAAIDDGLLLARKR